jgi:uncharacterized membrane protein HdeD (DUF308 family)
MSVLKKFNDEHLPDFHGRGKVFLVLGILLVILGLFAISVAMLTTFLSVILLGVLLFTSGLILFCDSFSFWRRKSGFVVHFLISLLYIAVGLLLIVKPVMASISLTLMLGIFYIIMGVFRISFASGVQTPSWGWAWFNGLIALAIGILIITSWPQSSFFIIGLFVGIDLVFAGLAYIMASLSGRNASRISRR